MELRVATIVGAGTMGAGIAQACAQAGLEAHLVDADPQGLERGMGRIRDFWAKGVSKGKTRAEDVAAWQARLHPTSDLDAAVGVSDLIIEAVPEQLALKRSIFAKLDAVAPAHAILATNTSSLSIDAIAQATKRPNRVVGFHFFNPVPLMPLLEIVRHAGTDAQVVDAGRALAARMGKTPIVVRDSPGFATSRLGIVLGNEAMRMLSEGVASAKDIDTAMKLGYGHPMGPLELSDLVGLDVRHDIGEYLHARFGGEHYRSPPLIRALVKRGELGKKSGRGIYDWSTGQPVERTLPLEQRPA